MLFFVSAIFVPQAAPRPYGNSGKIHTGFLVRPESANSSDRPSSKPSLTARPPASVRPEVGILVRTLEMCFWAVSGLTASGLLGDNRREKSVLRGIGWVGTRGTDWR